VWSILLYGISLNTSYRFCSSSFSTLAVALPLAGHRLLSPPHHGYSFYAVILLPQPRRPLHRIFVRRSASHRPLHDSSLRRPRRPLWRVFIRRSSPRRTLRGSSPHRLRRPHRGSYLRRPCRSLWRVFLRCSSWRRLLHDSSPCRLRCPQRGSYPRWPHRPLRCGLSIGVSPGFSSTSPSHALTSPTPFNTFAFTCTIRTSSTWRPLSASCDTSRACYLMDSSFIRVHRLPWSPTLMPTGTAAPTLDVLCRVSASTSLTTSSHGLRSGNT
jgi:hypothetical protein